MRCAVEAVGAGAGELDRRRRRPGRAGGELHDGRAADVGGADEEDRERLGHRVGPVEVEVAGLVERDEDVVERVLDGAAGGVDAHGGVVGLLVGRGDAGELGDLAAAGLGVEALAVAALALLERRGDVDEEERAAGVLDHLPHLLRGSRRTARSGCRPPRRRGGRSRRPPSRCGGCWSRGPPWRRSGPADRWRRTTSPSRLVTVRPPCSRSGPSARGPASTCRCRTGR